MAGLWALGCYGLGPAGSAEGWRHLLRRPQVYYLAFTIVAVGSAVHASSPLASLSKSVEIVVMAFFMGAIVHHVHSVPGATFERALGLWNLTLALVALALFALLLGALADPATGMQPLPGAILPARLVGGVLQIHPNTSGQLGATLVVVGLNRSLRLRRPAESVFWLGLMALGLVVLTLAQARTSVAAVLVAVPLVLFLNRRFALGSMFALISLIGAALMIQTLQDYILRGQSFEQFMTGTGRTSIWQVAWAMVEEAPFLGSGFYTGVRIDLTERYRILDLSNVDNTPLEVLVGVGVLGTVPFVLFVASFVRRVLGNLAVPAYRGLFVEVLATLIIMGFRLAFGPTVQLFSFSLLIVTVLAAFAGPLRPPPARPARAG
jgi:O-antigen ligase